MMKSLKQLENALDRLSKLTHEELEFPALHGYGSSLTLVTESAVVPVEIGSLASRYANTIRYSHLMLAKIPHTPTDKEIILEYVAKYHGAEFVSAKFNSDKLLRLYEDEYYNKYELISKSLLDKWLKWFNKKLMERQIITVINVT